MKTYPLLQAQLGIFLQCIQHPTSTQYNLPCYCLIPATVNINRLEKALNRLVRQRKELRTRFMIDSNGEVRQWSDSTMNIPVIRRSFTEAEFYVYIDKDFIRPFDLLSGEPLFRVELIETEKGWFLLIDGSHSIVDGVALSLVLAQEDVNKVYMGEELEDYEYGMYQAAEEETALFGTETYERAKAYYAEKFAGMDFSTISKSESGTMGKMIHYSSFINRELCDEWSKANGTQVNLLFQAAFSFVISVLTRQEKVAYFTVNHGRMDKRLRHCVGMFAKSVPILANAAPDIKVIDFIKKLRAEMMSTIRYGAYPFNQFCRDLNMTSGVSFNFVAISDVEEVLILEDDRIHVHQPPRAEMNDDMAVCIYIKGNDYEIRVESSNGMNDQQTLQMMGDAVFATMKNMMECPESQLRDIPIVLPEEEKDILALSQGEVLAYDRTETWVDLFKRQAVLSPDSIAIVDTAGELSYQELDKCSDSFASYLIEHGIQADEFIAIRMDRSKEFMVAALGAHKAGVAYMPIDLDYPADRVEYMLSDSEAKLVVTEKTVSEALRVFDAPVSINRANPEGLAYMIYTSGSTGMPKGVMIQHKALLNFVHFIRKEWRLTKLSRIACHSNFAFDAAVEDLYPILTVGGTLYVVPEEARMDISLLRQYIQQNGITGGCYTTQLGQLLGSGSPLEVDYICLGGEKMTAIPHTTGRVLNTYGPTEFTVDATFFEVDPNKSYGNIPIGRPLYNLKTLVLDKHGNLLPRGVVGELCMAGPQIAKGYWKRPDLTDEKFCRSKVLGDEKMYHTGDLARYNADGDLEYMGRIDFQVKLRGYRIELGEIENRANQFESIRQVAAEVKNGQTLCLYYTADNKIDKNALKAYLLETLAEYMVPSVFMQLDQMPLTSNGKVNRKLLPNPEMIIGEIVEPDTELERSVFDIAREILNIENFGVTTNLLSIGLTSLSVMKMTAAIHQRFGIQMKIAVIMKSPTVRAIAESIKEQPVTNNELCAYEKREFYPLTESQRGIYVDWEMNRSTTQYNIPLVYRFSGLDADKLAESLKIAVDAHCYLKTRLIMIDGNVLQQRHDLEATVITIQDLETEPDVIFFQQKVRPFDLFNDKLYRLELYRSSECIHLFMDIHHLIFDGLSTGIFLKDALIAYNGGIIQAENITAYDFALYEQEIMEKEAFVSAESHFDKLVANTNVLTFPASTLPDGVPSSYITISFPAAAIKSFCSANTVTIGSFLQAAFAETMTRLTRESHPLYLTISNGRSAYSALQSCVGMFVKTLPVVMPPTADNRSWTTIDYVKAMHEQLHESYELDFYPYTHLVQRHQHRAEVMFIYQGGIGENEEIEGCKQIALTLDATKFPLNISVYPEDENFTILVEYDGMRYGKSDMEILASALANVSVNMAGTPLLKDVELVSATHRAELTDLGSGDSFDFDTSETIVSMFRKRAAQTPDSVALVYKDRRLSYREIDEMTDRLASHLIKKYDIRAEEAVGVMITRSELLLIYPMAVMKAGGSYMPLDHHFPADRLHFMCEDAKVRVILSEGNLVEENILGFTGEVFLSSELESIPSGLLPETVVPNPQSRMVILYTSGSTGNPKGVELEHHGIVNFCHWYVHEFGMSEIDRIVGYANFGFDAHMIDLYPTILAGATVYILADDIRKDLIGMNNYMEKNALSIAFLTTQIGCQIMQMNHSLRVLSTGGEKMPPVSSPAYRFLNVYGPTECSLFSTYYDVNGYFEGEYIGRPLDNYRLYIIDQHYNLVPQGVAGELLIAGAGLARGYLNQPELTNEKFIVLEGERAYRSGDLVRWSANGNIEFLGRIDNQVKLRGLRIELGEIENRIASYEGIRQVCVDVKEIGGAQNLCAYYSADTDVDVARLKDFIAKSLTEFMVPTAYMQLERLPLNPNGKVDRKALPIPEVELDEIIAPETELEKKLFDIVAAQLKTETFGVTNNLVSLGLSSLAAMRLNADIQQQLGFEIQFKDLLSNPTIRHLVDMIEIGELKRVSSMRLGSTVKPEGGQNPLQKRTGGNPLQKKTGDEKDNPLLKR